MQVPEFNQSTQLAIEGDRRASLAMWQKVAQGDLSLEVRAWLQHVAEGVLDAESKPAGRLRDSAIVRAGGLAGNVDKHRELREFAAVLDEVGAPRARIISAVRSNGRALGVQPEHYQDMTDHELGKLIGEELRKARDARSD